HWFGGATALGQVTPELCPPLAQIFHLWAVVREAQEGDPLDLLIRDRNGEAIAEFAQGLKPHLLLLMGDVLALARLAHAVTLHRLGQNDGWLAGMLHGSGVGGKDLDRIGATAAPRPELIVPPHLHQLPGLGIFAE